MIICNIVLFSIRILHNYSMKKLVLSLATIVAATSFSLCGCNPGKSKTPILENNAIHHDDEFGGAYIDISIDSFNKLGFKFGDSVNLEFTTSTKI